MAKHEVFANPTVDKVIFQVRFPNLFYIESAIGEYQQRIMDRFPTSHMMVKRNFFMASVSQAVEEEEPPPPPKGLETQPIWNFISEDGVELNVLSDSLDITSTVHKTYNNRSESMRFRDSIEFAVNNFLEVVQLPKFTRLGLRYIDKCPVPKQDNRTYKAWYKTAFPLSRFPVSDATEMLFRVRCRRKGYFLHYREFFRETGNGPSLNLDFDGYATDVPSGDYLAVTDQLHDIIGAEYKASIKEPLLKHMREAKRRRPKKGGAKKKAKRNKKAKRRRANT